MRSICSDTELDRSAAKAERQWLEPFVFQSACDLTESTLNSQSISEQQRDKFISFNHHYDNSYDDDEGNDVIIAHKTNCLAYMKKIFCLERK
jgi:hypothetical protein